MSITLSARCETPQHLGRDLPTLVSSTDELLKDPDQPLSQSVLAAHARPKLQSTCAKSIEAKARAKAL